MDSKKRPPKTTAKVKDMPTRKGHSVKGGLLNNTSFRVNTLTFSSNATGIG
jgi:hypothetical protein